MTDSVMTDDPCCCLSLATICEILISYDFIIIYYLYKLLYVDVICFYVCNFVNCAAACLGQDTLGKEIFNLNEFYSG